MTHRILVIEDDPIASEEIISQLQTLGYGYSIAATIEVGIFKAWSGNFDLITLDRILPDGDGLRLLADLRAAGINTPVLMISALGDLDERVKGLRAGGDDYLTKPFASIELAARLEALLRRNQKASHAATVLYYEDLELNLISRVATRDNQDLELQPTEFKLLEYMMRCAGQTVTRTMIFEAIWGYQFDPGTNVIDVHMGKLRKKIDLPGRVPLIHTIRGSGYILGARDQ